MKPSIAMMTKKTAISMFVASLLLVSLKAYATTTVTVDDNNKVVVTQPSAAVQTIATPMIVTSETLMGDLEGRISQINYSQNWIIVQDLNGNERQVTLKQELINNYRIGDYVRIHPSADVILVTVQENPKDFEGEITRVDTPKGQIMVLDTNGRERRVQLKQGMIGTYKVQDYVRVHLMADLKEAKTIETVRDVKNLEGRIVAVDVARSQIVVRESNGKDSAVLVRQGQIDGYRTGDKVQIYLLPNQEQVQVIRVIQ